MTPWYRRCVVRGRRNPLYFGLSYRLKKARGKLSFSSVAASSGLADANTVFLLERKPGHMPRLDTVERLAYGLGLSPAFLAYGIETDGCHPMTGLRCQGIAGRLRQQRTLRGLTMRAVSELAGLSHPTTRSTETGTTIPSIATAEALANALGVSPGWLAYGLGPVELPNRRAIRSKSAKAEPSESDTSADPAV